MKRFILFCKDFDPFSVFDASLEVASYMLKRSETHIYDIDKSSLEFNGPEGRRVKLTCSPDVNGSFCYVEIEDTEIGQEEAPAYDIKTIYGRCGLSEVMPS